VERGKATVVQTPWTCWPVRGGCGELVGDEHQAGEPCPHCGEHAVTRICVIAPDPTEAER
jgi:predicted RNA-binding Zn-ribbon protein involved in translation (DUF1610 family)